MTKLARVEALFKALADATRLRILALLVGGEICVCEIHGALKLPQPTVSRHLAYLRRSGLVDSRRDGLWIHYRLSPLADPVLDAISVAVQHALTHADVVRRDADRLQKKGGCCLPTPADMTHFACCGAAAAR